MKNKCIKNKRNGLISKTMILVASFMLMLYYIVNMQQYDMLASVVIAISNILFIIGIAEYKQRTGLALAALLVGSICYSLTYEFDSMISQGYPWINVICYGISIFILLFTSGCIKKHKKPDIKQLLKPYATTNQSVATKIILVLIIIAITMALSASAVKNLDRLVGSGGSLAEFSVIDYSVYTLIIILNFLLPFELAFRMKNGQIYAVSVRAISLVVACIIAEKSTNLAYMHVQFIVLASMIMLVAINFYDKKQHKEVINDKKLVGTI